MIGKFRPVKAKRIAALSLAALMTFSVVGCGGGGGDDSDSDSTVVSGTAVNGPFVTGSQVTLQKIDPETGEADPNTDPVTVEVTDDLGTYTATISWSGATDISVTGSYLDTATGELSEAESTMQLITDVEAGATQTANVTTITTISAPRITKLLQQDVSIEDAQRQADVETATEVLQIYDLPEEIKLQDLNPLEGDTASDDMNMYNAQLLAFDVAVDTQAKEYRDAGMSATDAAPTGILSDWGNDLAADGSMDVTTTLEEVKTKIETNGVSDFSSKLTDYLNERGSEATAPTVPTDTTFDTAQTTIIATDEGGRPPAFEDPEGNQAPSGRVEGVLEAGSDQGVNVVVTDPDAADSGHTFTVSEGTNGTFEVDASGNVTYTPTPGTEAAADKGVVTITDPAGLTSTVTVVVEAPPADASDNNAPTVMAGENSMALSEKLSVDLSALSSDNDSDDPAIFKVNNAMGGTVVVNGHMALFQATDVALVDGVGMASFDFQRFDGSVLSDTATVTITVGEDAVAPAPTVDSASISVGKNMSQTVTITGNDANTLDTEDTLTFGIATSATHGTVVQHGEPNQFKYTAPADVPTDGGDSFVLEATDAGGLSGTVTVNVTVLDLVAPAPQATYSQTWADDNLWFALVGDRAEADATVTITVDPNDANSSDDHTFAITTAPTKGTLTPAEDQTSTGGGTVDYTYVPFSNEEGEDTFTITVTENNTETLYSTEFTKTFRLVDEFPITPAPTADPTSVTLVGNGAATQDVVISANDANAGDSWSYALDSSALSAGTTVSDPTDNGDGTATVTVTAGTNSNDVGGDDVSGGSITATVTDSGGLSGDVTINITLTAPPPSAVKVKVSSNAGTSNYGSSIKLEPAEGIIYRAESCTDVFTGSTGMGFINATTGVYTIMGGAVTVDGPYDIIECTFDIATSFGRMPVTGDFGLVGSITTTSTGDGADPDISDFTLTIAETE